MKGSNRSGLATVATTLGAATLLALVSAVPAGAVINPTRLPTPLGNGLGLSSPSGEFLTIPSPGSGGAEPHGLGLPDVATLGAQALPGFPRPGPAFTILTTGDVTLADDANVGGSSGLDLFGPNIRGNSDRDVSVLRLAAPVTASDNCLSFEFRFLSEEFPEFVNAGFNDAFIAELRSSDWTTSGGAITAPNNFAFDDAGNPITIDAVGETAVAPYRSIATTYDSATRIARASAPLTGADQSAGSVNLFLSIFDQGDGIYDSAVFLDNLVVDNRASCAPGAKVLDPTDPETSAGQPKFKSALSSAAVASKKKKKPKVTIPFTSSETSSSFFCRFGLKAATQATPYEACTSPFKSKVKKGKRYQLDVVAIDGAGNPDPSPVTVTFKAKGKKKK
jgi:hypothetical protein